jgi:uncharacterized protein (TIGR02996 family)
VVAEDLLAKIYAAPEDDAPRLVYADHLTERGDPRGELINLQVRRARGEPSTRASLARERALLRDHGRAWLGPLAPVLARSGVVYERGFLAVCTLQGKRAADFDATKGHPAWATVRAIELRHMDYRLKAAIAALLFHRAMRSLRALTGEVYPDLFVAMSRHGAAPLLESVACNWLSDGQASCTGSDGQWGKILPDAAAFIREPGLVECPGLPRLRTLDLTAATHRVTPAMLGWFFAGELCRRIASLHVTATEEAIPAWADALASHPLPELVVSPLPRLGRYTLRRDARGRLGDLTVSFERCNAAGAAPFAAGLRLLERVDPGVFARITFDWPPRRAPTARQLGRIQQLRRRLQAVEIVEPA